jgi:DNA repair protein RadD
VQKLRRGLHRRYCGYLPQRPPRAAAFADGELGLVDRDRRAQAKVYDPAERERWHAMLIHVGMERGYKPGWASHKYKEKFGDWPPWGSAPQHMPPSAEVRSWVRSRLIAYAKARGVA